MKLSEKDILYEDNHLLILYKTGGLLTIPEGNITDSLLGRGKKYLKEKKQTSGNVFLYPPHRLDKPVSGIVVFAKTSKALSRLNEQIRDGVWQKEYLAHVDTVPSKVKGRLVHYLLQHNHRAYVYDAHKSGTKEAVLEYEVVGPHLIRIRLITGRYHQIRVQLSAIGSPIRGDAKYGSKTKKEKIGLEHVKLTLLHPVSKMPLTVSSQKNIHDIEL
ncbi:MAG: hypothetical protein A3F09_02240 [Chlamydiae bacterium RIFCSPHIGHO2_12_FULL_49_11]|nr:MAG: hypothetical protein A3F09_02240 [Chlamydiae bacterium RIFCSPHIGHO2_12_FULL_49_11]